MKKRWGIILAAVGLLIVPLFAGAGVAGATDFRSGGNIVVEEGETINSSLFVAGDAIEIAGTVEGDVFCAATTVRITGTIRGDVICAAQDMQLRGNIDGDVRVAADTLVIESVIAGNASVLGSELRFENTSLVEDVSAAVTTAQFNGEVRRDVAVTGNEVTIDGQVGRNIQADIGQLNLSGEAQVGGDISYRSDNRIAQSESAVVTGDVNRQAIDESAQFGPAQMAASAFFLLLTMLVTSMTIVALFPRVTQRVSSNGIERLGSTVLSGLAAVVIAPIIIFLLIISVFGSLIGFTLLTVYILMLILSGPFFAYYLGRLLMASKSRNPLLYMFVGSLCLLLLYIIPIINVFALLAAGVVGSGMLAQEVIRRGANPVYDTAVIEGKQSKKHHEK